MYKRILLALDLIEHDDNAVIQRARELKEYYDAELHIIHVVEQFYNYGPPPYPFNVTELQEELIEGALEKVRPLAESLGVDEKQIHYPVGKAKEQVIEVSREIEADLIILGNHSRRGIGSLFLGSTADGVLRGASCDVLAVRVQLD